MGLTPKDQPASRAVEEPKRNILPYAAVAVVGAVAIWTIQQPNNFEPQSPSGNIKSGSRTGKELPGTTSTSAKGDMRTLFSADDYPAEAQRKGEEGTVQAELTVDQNGRVSACRVVRSSGSTSLDTASCSLLTRRGRFTPARDAEGRAVVNKITSPPIVWRLEG